MSGTSGIFYLNGETADQTLINDSVPEPGGLDPRYTRPDRVSPLVDMEPVFWPVFWPVFCRVFCRVFW